MGAGQGDGLNDPVKIQGGTGSFSGPFFGLNGITIEQVAGTLAGTDMFFGNIFDGGHKQIGFCNWSNKGTSRQGARQVCKNWPAGRYLFEVAHCQMTP